MKKFIFERAYAGEVPRPSVETFNFESENLIIVGTPWGNQDALKQLADTFREFISASVGDQEATSPFAKLPGLSPRENSLRSAALLANDGIFSKLNRESYSSACEALILHTHGSELSWVQVGQPHLFLLRNNEINPLQFSLDLSLDYRNLTPLPSRLFGLERSWDLETKSLVTQLGDQLIVMARSKVPAGFYSVTSSVKPNEDLGEKIFDLVTQDDHKMPFWLGIIK